MKIECIEEAVTATSFGEYVRPIEITPSHGASVAEVSVDVYGNMVLRAADGQFVLFHLDHWGKLDKLARFAKKAGWVIPLL